MILNKSFPYNSSYKTHVIIGAVLGLLLGFILIVLKPLSLNIDKLDSYGEILIMGFGVIKFFNYMFADFIANYFYTKNKSWTWWNEIIFLLISTLSGAILGYLYLELIIVKQPLSFRGLILFFFYIVLPITPLLVFPKAVLRYLFSRDVTSISINSTSTYEPSQEKRIFLKGQNAKDKLILTETQLIYVKSVDNYSVIYYQDGDVKSKMLRASLAELASQAPFLIQPHRSYLINPKHDLKINGNSQKAFLSSINFEEHIPIARASYKSVKSLFS